MKKEDNEKGMLQIIMKDGTTWATENIQMSCVET